MKHKPFLVIAAAGVLFGWFAPDLSQKPAAGQLAAHTMAPVASPQQGRAAALVAGTDLVLARAGDGHFYADVLVDGARARMLVDTGATVVALTGADADAMGIVWDPAEIRPVARGASGTVYGVPVTIGRMEVGEFEATGVQAIVVPDGLGISLLGQSFLSQVPRVEIDSDRMVLGG